ncbi:MAG: site-specific integrase [Sedimentisphaerales bacterium]|nr:site-specific integrase [Sedimentisphaerales bacterium]
MKTKVRGNAERFYFVTREETGKLLKACNGTEWRLVITLARYGGLRTPSEVLALTWDCVNWELDRIRIISPKTEHIEGRAWRWIPIYPELKPYLLDSYEQAEPGTQWVITRYRDSSTNLRTQLGRIAHRAGVDLWQKPWQNMRATRQTELADIFPQHVVSYWMGNSEPIANEHYLQVTDDHYEAAQNPAHLAQKAAQYGVIQGCTDLHGFPEDVSQVEDNARVRNTLQPPAIQDKRYPVPPRGLEPLLPG